VVLLDRKINKAQEAAAFRRPTGLGEKSPGDVMRQLYDHPLSAEEVAAFSREADVLGKEAVQTLHNAAEQKEFAAFMMATQLMPTLRARLTEAAASQKRAPDISYEEFTGQTLRKNMLLFFELFQSTGHAAKAAQLAGEDAEAIGAVALLVFTSRFVTAMRQGREPAAEDLALVAAMQKMLVEIARADDSVRAARACEAVSAFGIMSVLAGRRPEHPELLLRAVQLDPFRHRNLSFLIGLSMTLKEKRYATAAAVVEMQLAVLPNPLTRRQAAAVAARLHDWDAALRHLDAADKEKPGDLGVLSQRIATLLRQSPSKATIKKTGLLYGDITPDTVLEKTGGMEKDERKEFIHNHLLHLIIAQRSADAEMELKAAVEAGIFSEEEAKELRGFMR
jgi:tetratricopeptide (TPR) repeat protein